MNRLSRSRIEYLDYVWNFYSGCEHWSTGICPVPNCWARSLTQRFPAHYPNGFEPTFYPEAFLSPLSLKKPSRIGICFMGDLFGDWVDPQMAVPTMTITDKRKIFSMNSNKGLRDTIFDIITILPQHTFLFLTKAPWNYRKWGKFPDNCWLGATVTDEPSFVKAFNGLQKANAAHKWLSIEPFLRPFVITDWELHSAGISWIVIGAQTHPYQPPKISWVQEILVAAHNAGDLPVFIKNNIRPLLEKEWPSWKILQELPR